MSVEKIARIANSVWLQDTSDNFLNNNPLLYELWNNKRITEISFGADIRRGAVFASNLPEFTDADGNSITVQSDNHTTSVIVNYKYMPKKVPISIEQLNLKGSTEEQVKWIKGELDTAQGSILNATEYALFGDGTSSGGLAFDGLAAAISKDPSVGQYGQLDPATLTQWRNKAFNIMDPSSGLIGAGNAFTPDTAVSSARSVINKLASNNKKPTHAFCDGAYYELFEEGLEDRQRLVSIDGPSAVGERGTIAGFEFIYYKGVKMVNASGLKRVPAGALVGITPLTAYFFNISDVEFVYINRVKQNESLLKELKIAKNDVNTMVYPNMENGILLHKNPDNSAYYIELRITGNLILSDRGNTAVLYEAVI